MLESRFIRLTDYCIVEFMFSNVDQPELVNADLFLIQNEHTNTHQIYNDNNSLTNNIQDNTAVPIGGNKYMYIDEEKIPDYIDADPKLHKTNIGNMLYAYDIARVHFITGFNFAEWEALIFGVKQQENDLKYNIFTSILLTESIADGIITFNPKPLFLTDVIYDRYIDVKIPSIKKINKDYYNDAFIQADQLGAKITTNLDNSYTGFINNTPIILTMDESISVATVYVDDVPYDEYTISEHSEVPLEQYNEFDNFGVHIDEAEDGDYIEIYATYNGGFPAELISYLNSKNPHNNWLLTHELSLYEQIGSTFLNTNRVMYYQTDSFDEPYLIRPVLKYAQNALSFSYDYIVRLVNQLDGAQIIRSGSYSSTNPKKYGKYIQPINIANNIVPHKVYNKLIKKSFESDLMYIPDDNILNTDKSSEVLLTQRIIEKVYLPMFVNNNNIMISDANINLNQINDVDSLLYGQHELPIILNPFDNLFRFYFFEKVEDKIEPYNINISDNYQLVFMSNKEEVSVDRTVSITRVTQGEMIFLFTEEKARKILDSDDNNFYITTTTDEGSQTVVYHGVWYPVDKSDYVKSIKQQKLDDALVVIEDTEDTTTGRVIIDPAIINTAIEIPGDIPAGA